MLTRKEKLTKGLLSLAFMLMLVAAVVAEQARANLPEDTVTTMSSTPGTRSGILLDAEALEKISSLPSLLGRVALPVSVDACLDLLRRDASSRTTERSPLQ